MTRSNPDVRFESLADIAPLNWNVRFTPESGHQTDIRLSVYEYTP